MREILFRGVIKDKDDREFFGKFWHGDLINYTNGAVVIRQQECGQQFEVIAETVSILTDNGDYKLLKYVKII